jgi:ethanolaminephosphotransferase
LLVYQTLDNMDGKQARRTGSSTPLGLLFDHGCDAVNSIFGSAGWILGLGLSWDRDYFICLTLIFGPFSLFFAATWEEYHTGELILPTINGPSEGLVGAAILSLVAYFHPQFWQSTTISDSIGLSSVFTTPIRNADIQVFVASLGIIRELVVRTFSVTKKYGIKSLTLQLPFWIFVSLQVVNRNLWITLPRTALHLSSAIFVENVTQLMMNHVTDTEYSIAFRYAILIPVALLMVLEHFINLGDIKSHLNFFDCSDLWIVYTTILWTYLFCKFRLIVHEICLVLDIQCFHISKQTKQK